MRARLLILGGFAHDSQGVLTAVDELALVRVELLLDVGLGLRLPAKGLMRRELRVAEFANSEYVVVSSSDDSKFSLCHAPSLRCWASRSRPVEIKRHHYPGPDCIDSFSSDGAHLSHELISVEKP